jgi:formylglycine-generating enzyme
MLFGDAWYSIVLCVCVTACGGKSPPSIDMDSLSDLSVKSEVVHEICAPACAARQCGADGCGSVCGECSDWTECTENGLCVSVSCGTSLDCPGDAVCHPDSDLCVQCVASADCPGLELCGPDHECHSPGNPCDSDKDCKSEGMVCDFDAGHCVECLNASACSQEEYCKDGYCLPDICIAGEAVCNEDTVVVCLDDGSDWTAVQVCESSNACRQGECIESPCSAEQPWCLDAQTLAECTEDGSRSVEVPCPDEHFCMDGQCLPWNCTPNADFCLEGAVAQCDDTGDSYAVVDPCDNGDCEQGECVESVEPVCGDDSCEPGEDCNLCPIDCGLCPNCPACGELEECNPLLGSCVANSTLVPEGDFWMGCKEGPLGTCSKAAVPYHEVILDAYQIDITEVTAKQYAHCVDHQGCQQVTDADCEGSDQGGTNYLKPGKHHHPMNCVPWKRAQAYCQWAEKRLCTEAEWEKAARGGCDIWQDDCKEQSPMYPWGDGYPSCDLADYSGCPPDINGTSPVGSRPEGASPYGLYDMAGNVYELTADWYSHDYYCMGPDADTTSSGGAHMCEEFSAPHPEASDNPKGPAEGVVKVVRGGCWKTLAADMLTVYRRDPGSSGSTAMGFRCCSNP